MFRRWVAYILLLVCALFSRAQNPCAYAFKASDKESMEKAVEQYEKRHYPDAGQLFRKIQGKNPKAADPYFYLGMIATKDNNVTAIRKYFGKLQTLCPDYPNALAHFWWGVINYTDERYEEAVANLNRFFEIANNDTKSPGYMAAYEEASNYLYWSQFLAEASVNAVPFSPNVVFGASSASDELMPYITWDGKNIYYLRKMSVSKEKTVYAKLLDETKLMLCMSRWRDTMFSSGEVLQEPFNMGAPEGGVSLTADGNLLVYSVYASEKGISNFDIFYTEKKGGVWQPIKNAGTNVNDLKAWDSQPTISPDGQTLYFASNRPGGQGGTDIWMCRRLPNGDWSRAENLGPSVNTAGNEKCPFLHADGKTLYFASNGWQGFGGYDMYFINLNDRSAQRPTNMGMPINGEGDEICFGIVADGKRAYFADKSKDYNGVGGSDIFWFDLYPDARPEPMKWIKTVAFVPVDKSPCTIKVKRYGAPEARYTIASKESAVMLSVAETNIVSAEMDGYFPQVAILQKSDVQRLSDYEIRLKPLEKESSNILRGKIFDERKGVLTDDGKKVLDAYAAYLIEHPRIRVRVEALKAAESRAIYEYLLSQKLRPDRLSHRYGTEFMHTQITIVDF